jgi:hypothetical protein
MPVSWSTQSGTRKRTYALARVAVLVSQPHERFVLGRRWLDYGPGDDALWNSALQIAPRLDEIDGE